MSRFIACLAAALLLCPAPGRGETTPGAVSLLLYPPAVDAALPAAYQPALQQAITKLLAALPSPALQVTVFNRAAPEVRRLLLERPFLDQQALAAGTPAFIYVLGEELGFDAALVCSLTVQPEGGMAFSARLVSVRNRGVRAYGAGGQVVDYPADSTPAELERLFTVGLLSGMRRDLPADIAAAGALPPLGIEDYRKQGQELAAQGRYYEAIHEYDRALALDPKAVDCYVSQAQCLTKVGDLAAARLQLKRAQALKPDDPLAMQAGGDLALLDGAFEQALTEYERVLAALPANRPALTGKAQALAGLHREAEAAVCYEELLASQPADAGVVGALAAVYERLGKDDLAIKLYTHLLALAPDQAAATRQRLIVLYTKAGNLAGAVEQYRQAFQRQSAPVAYNAEDYASLAVLFDTEAERVRVGVLNVWSSYQSGKLPKDELEVDMTTYLGRSDNLARAAERVTVPSALQPGLKYRVFAYNLLNQSDFELQLFLDRSEARRYERAMMLRDAASSALAKAQSLDTAARQAATATQAAGGV